MTVSRNDYKILIAINNFGSTTEMKSLTIKKLKELTGLSISKIRGTIAKFKELEYLREGVVQHNAKTYFITRKGQEQIKKIL